MIFSTPAWAPQGPIEIPDSLPVGDFAIAGRPELANDERPMVTCGLTDRSYTRADIRHRVELLARSLCRELGWSPNVGSPEDKVVAILSLNSIDYMILCWAIHRINGICLPLHGSSSVAEITNHMRLTGCKIFFTCWPLLQTCLKGAEALSIEKKSVFLIDLPSPLVPSDSSEISGFKTLGQLVQAGKFLKPCEELTWKAGQGKGQIAYLCSTSGTAGKQKLAQISHYNVIANVIQATTYEDVTKAGIPETATGVLPMSHAYGLEVAHIMLWRNDRLIVHPQFDMQAMLEAVATYSIQRLYLVPPIINGLIHHSGLLQKFDVSSVTTVVSGAAPLNEKVSNRLVELQPTWNIVQAYGLTETSIIATLTSPYDIYLGSSGCLLPGVQARLIDPDGTEIENYDTPGEVLIASPSLFVGYLGDTRPREATFADEHWLRTGDVGLFRRSEKESEHLFIVDRLKDMIKVNGKQVAPADIEAQLLQHPAVTDAAVIGVPDENAGELAHAFVAISSKHTAGADVQHDIRVLIENTMSSIYWLGDRISILDKIPRSQSGKILKKDLRGYIGGVYGNALGAALVLGHQDVVKILRGMAPLQY